MPAMNTNTINKSRAEKISVIMLTLAVFYCMSSILSLYTSFLTFPPLFETIEDIKFAVGLFYMPFVTAVFAFGSIIMRFRASTRKLSQLFTWLGLILSSGIIAWWLMFESGFLPTIFLPFFFLWAVINDIRVCVKPG